MRRFFLEYIPYVQWHPLSTPTVMITAGQDDDGPFIQAVDRMVFVGDAASPEAGRVADEGFRGDDAPVAAAPDVEALRIDLFV